jgi:hypothetical protein
LLLPAVLVTTGGGRGITIDANAAGWRKLQTDWDSVADELVERSLLAWNYVVVYIESQFQERTNVGILLYDENHRLIGRKMDNPRRAARRGDFLVPEGKKIEETPLWDILPAFGSGFKTLDDLERANWSYSMILVSNIRACAGWEGADVEEYLLDLYRSYVPNVAAG